MWSADVAEDLQKRDSTVKEAQSSHSNLANCGQDGSKP